MTLDHAPRTGLLRRQRLLQLRHPGFSATLFLLQRLQPGLGIRQLLLQPRLLLAGRFQFLLGPFQLLLAALDHAPRAGLLRRQRLLQLRHPGFSAALFFLQRLQPGLGIRQLLLQPRLLLARIRQLVLGLALGFLQLVFRLLHLVLGLLELLFQGLDLRFGRRQLLVPFLLRHHGGPQDGLVSRGGLGLFASGITGRKHYPGNGADNTQQQGRAAQWYPLHDHSPRAMRDDAEYLFTVSV